MRALREIISATELELQELQVGFSGQGDQRPSLVIEVNKQAFVCIHIVHASSVCHVILSCDHVIPS